MNLLWKDQPPHQSADSDFIPYFDAHPAKTTRPRGAVIVLPGGGYANRAPHEADPVAERFVDSGLNAFVLHYRVAPNRHPAPLMDVARALRIVRRRADEWQVIPDRIAVLGFSAGGHLTASLGVFHDEVPEIGDEVEETSCRPDALVLCYSVISSGSFGHKGSFTNLLGPDPSQAELEKRSLELQVTGITPPTFLWHTADDGSVPLENSLSFAGALRRHDVPVELHVYPTGPHGMGLAENEPHVATWFDLAVEWLESMGW